jgi:thioesterase domain-containing protein
VQSEAALQTELLQLWGRLLQIDTITLDDDFFDRGGDSLLGIELIAEIARITGRSIPESILFEASSVRKIVQRLLAYAEIKANAVVEVGPVGDANPLLFFHGDLEGGLYLEPFARVLAPFQPLVAVVPHGMGGEKVPGTVEEMAQDRMPAILEYRPQGPYRLGGLCAGGMVALETARLLVSKGHEVEFVVMVDPVWTGSGEPYPTLAKRPRGTEWARRWARRALSSRDLIARSMRLLRFPTMGPVTLLRTDSESELAEPIKIKIYQKYVEALKKYRPAPVSVPVIVFASVLDGRPWQEISRNFELCEHPGGHYDWVTSRAFQFASHLRAYIGARQ